jgi:hypothetical protein
MNNTILFLAMMGVVAISLMVGLVLTQYAHGQTIDNQITTFDDCYDKMLGFITLFLMFHHISIDDLETDPSWKLMAKNQCNYHHEKTGTWGFSSDTTQEEFNQKYWDTLPEKYKKIWIENGGK